MLGLGWGFGEQLCGEETSREEHLTGLVRLGQAWGRR